MDDNDQIALIRAILGFYGIRQGHPTVASTLVSQPIVLRVG
jgi:hypothetical protein